MASNSFERNFRPNLWSLHRRQFLQIAGAFGVGFAAGGDAWAAEEFLEANQADPSILTELPELPAASAPCSNTPFGGPVYEGVEALQAGTLPDRAVFDLDRVWLPGQPITVKFLNGQSDPWTRIVQQKVRDIAPTWCDYANVTMEFVDSGRCHMTINFLPFGMYRYGLFNCLLGTDCYKFKSQVPSMNLLFDPRMQQWPADFRETEFQRLILHEFGHALALGHEHQREDRPIVWTESLFVHAQQHWGWNRETVQQQIINTMGQGNRAGTIFDVRSIMMYEYPKGVAYYQRPNSPANTLDPTRPFESPRNTSLTPLDKVAASVTYPKSATPLGEVTLMAGAAEQPGKITEVGQTARYRFSTGASGDYTVKVGGAMPALVSLMKERNSGRGSMGNVLAAVESSGQGGTTLRAQDLAANMNYFVEVRHNKPMKGTGEFTIALA